MNIRKKLMAVSFAACCMASGVFADVPSPTVWWKMDSLNADGYVPDETGGGNHLQLGGGCTLTNDVRLGMKGVYFAGTSNTWAIALNNTQFMGSRSVSLWLCRSSTDGPLDPALNKIPYLFRNVSGFGVNYTFNSLKYSLCPNMGDSSFTMSSEVPRLEWHHLVFVLEKIETEVEGEVEVRWQVRAYVDGQGIYTQYDTSGKGVLATSEKIIIGNNTPVNGLATRPYNGMLSDVRVYDTALYATDAMALYREGMLARKPYLVGRWPMESLGEADSSGNMQVDPDVANLSTLSAYGVQVLEDGAMGGALNFPEGAGTAAWTTLPFETVGVSFGIWLNIATNLLDETKHNNLPHVYVMHPCGRMCIEGAAGRGLADNRAHVFDSGTLNDSNDQGFWCPDITHKKGEWSHLGVTYEMKPDAGTGVYGIEPRIYVNGELVSTGRWVTAAKLLDSYRGLYPRNSSFTLGNNGNGKSTARAFGGDMDEFTLFAGVLTAGQMRDLAAGLPEVSAGADFSVAADTATLHGQIGTMGMFGRLPAAAVTPTWSLLDAPQGAEVACVLQPDNLNTIATLPVEGVYTFRLTIADDLGRTATDDVVVTRIASPAGNVAPTVSVSGVASAMVGIPVSFAAAVSDPDGPGTPRIFWKVLSGPDAVRFEPAQAAVTKATFFGAGTYSIAAVASDGCVETVSSPVEVTVVAGDTLALTNGLIGYWPFTADKRDRVTGTAFVTEVSSTVDHTKLSFEPGIDGFGVRVHGEFYPYLNTKVSLLEDIDHSLGYDKDDVPLDRYRAFSCWIYHDSSDTNNSSHATIIDVPYTLGLWYNCEDGLRRFSMYQQTLNTQISGYGNVDVYERPSGDPVNRWTHVYALFDRKTGVSGNTSELWIDGVKQTNRITNGMGGGRVKNDKTILIGGHNQDAYPGNNGHFDNRSRTFPGIIDEVRMYNRALTEAEIKYLANNPVVDVKRPPAVSGEPDTLQPTVRKEKTIEVKVNTEAYPSSTALSYAWCVLSGDASKLVFADATSRATTITATKAGTYVIQLAVYGGTRTVYSAPIAIDVQQAGMVIKVQ